MKSAQPSSLRAWLTAIVLFAALALAFMDRQVINLLTTAIKAQFGLSDVAMSTLVGIAFSGLFMVAIMPAGWLSDRFNRRNLVLVAALLWSVFGAFCGLAGGYWQFFFARAGLGLCEAVVSPTAIPMIADLFPPGPRAKAVSIYNVGSGTGVGLSLVLGALILRAVDPHNSGAAVGVPLFGALHPWQIVYLVLAVGGGIVIALALLAIREPQRTTSLTEAKPSGNEIVQFVILSLLLSGAVLTFVQKGPWYLGALLALGGIFLLWRMLDPKQSAVLAFVAQHPKVFVPHFLGMALAGVCVFGILSWLPAHMQRTFGWAPSEIGFRYGTMYLLLAAPGAVVAGFFAEWLIKRGVIEGTLTATWVTLVGFAVFGIAGTAVAAPALAVPLLIVMMFFISMPYGPAVAVLTQVAPPAMRGRVLGLYLFCFNAASLTLGPLVPALFTDYVYKSEKLVGYSLATTLAILEPIAILLLILATRPFRAAAAEAARAEIVA